MSIRAPVPWPSFFANLRRHSYQTAARCVQCGTRNLQRADGSVWRLKGEKSRPFSLSARRLKKAGKANFANARTDSSSPVEGAAKSTAVDEAFDFSTLQASILKSIETLTHELAQLRPGGRFNPEKIESLKVELKDGRTRSKTIQRVRDLAQVISKGRSVEVVVHDEQFVKPVNTAIVTSPLNLTPHGPNESAPLTLHIQIPPPTAESRVQALETAKSEQQKAVARIREAGQKHQKKLRTLQLERKVNMDDIFKAKKQMEDIVKKGNEDAKRNFEDAKKVLDKT